MTQLSLFDFGFANVTGGPSVAGHPDAAASPVPANPVSASPVPVVRPSVRFSTLLPETSPTTPNHADQVDGAVYEEREKFHTAPPTSGDRPSLKELAMAIHQGRQQLERAPKNHVNRIGDLAQIVLRRHQMVAQRRARHAARLAEPQAILAGDSVHSNG
ncbi:hypothetical protein [Crateriforma conspicua]|uniref:Uncharacterized protein n=1 Tax=Crateriforma conspicua TaxID=2527996 RepID=A0A5C5Y0U7_9PLAN|nr:hypothetical protein [Crateriforma conspicua]TWT67895.1 hypothetical protein Pan14r_01330 [Crateriforma conspicua]